MTNPTHIQMPWNIDALKEWSIVGMNHYSIGGEKRLFVAMTLEGICIKAEGADERAVFEKLAQEAEPYL